jgi:phospholipid/cholesterol/gamma-HCH transport system permease protein
MSGHALPLARPGWLRAIAAIGSFVRVRASFLLMLGALGWGVLREALRPLAWRRTVRAEFWRALHQAAGGGLASALATAGLTGLALVSQALYWLGLAGQQELEGSLLVTVLVRELAPFLIGMILLGRSGTVTTTELGLLQLGGQVRIMAAQGMDPFLLLVLPRALAFAVANFTLGVLFILTALVVGFIAGSLLGSVQESLWQFLDHVLSAMKAADFAMFPAKMLAIGFLIALTACLTGLTARPGDDTAHLLPRAFVRGVLAIMLTSLLFSLAA